MGQDAFKYSGGGSNDFVRGLHSKADVDESERYICRFPEDNTIRFINSACGGNVLPGKNALHCALPPIRAKRGPDGPSLDGFHLFRRKGHRRGEPAPRAIGLLTGLRIVSKEPGQRFLSRLF